MRKIQYWEKLKIYVDYISNIDVYICTHTDTLADIKFWSQRAKRSIKHLIILQFFDAVFCISCMKINIVLFIHRIITFSGFSQQMCGSG